MIRTRVVLSLLFGLGLLNLGAGTVLAAEGDRMSDAQRRHAVAAELESEAKARIEKDVKQAVSGHHKGEPTAAQQGDAHAADEHEATNNNPLEFKKDLALFTAVVFVFLLLVLWKFAWGPISTSLDKREQAMTRQLSETAKNNEESKRLLAQYGEKLEQAKQEVRGILDQARRDAEATGRDIVAAAQQDAKTEQQRAVREIGDAKAEALQELAQRSAAMAVELAGKIVGSELRAADHAKLVEQAVEQFASVDES